ncbi:unnamed protein product [Moneuplotes crassus]|uniref:Uncharacterized protein n=1 Tax=Euplotes crassus TaxID=5936 RepID=A0AAD1U9A1_EUPCR|nr:unnamed protein product [Moneuplotes crassus]
MISADDSTLYFTAKSGAEAVICTFDTSAYNTNCFGTGTSSPAGLLAISNTRVGFFGVDTATDKGCLININPLVSPPTVNWQKFLVFPNSIAAIMNKGAATTNTDNTKIYGALPIGGSASTTLLVFVVLEESTGNLIGDSLVSNAVCTKVDAIYYFLDKIYVIGQFPDSRILVFDEIQSRFTNIYQSTGATYRGVTSDTVSGRLRFMGGKSNNPIIYKVFPENLINNGEFTYSNLDMTSATRYYEFEDRTYSYGAAVGQSNSGAAGHPNVANTITPTILWQTTVNRFEDPITLDLDKSASFNESLNITCSIGGTPTITYSFTPVDTVSKTEWLTFNETSFTLSGTSDFTADDQVHKYVVTSNWSGTPSGSSETYITLNVKSGEATTAGAVATAAAQAQVGIAAGIAVVNAAVAGNPPTSLWSLLQQLQMILLVMIIDEYTPADINEFLEGVSFALFNFDFLPAGDAPLFETPLDWLDFGEPSEKIQTLGIESISTLVNNFSFLFTYLCIMLIHFVLKIMPWFKQKNHPNCIIRNISKIREKVIDTIFYATYARMLLEAHEILAMTAVVEIKELDFSSAPAIVSYLISWVYLFLCLVILIAAFYLFYINREDYDPEKKTPTMEFFEGLKNTKWARFYTFLLLLRRMIFVLTVIFLLGNVDRNIIYSVLLINQVSYCCIFIYLRPFEELQDNIIESVNEVFLTAIICYLFAMTSEEKWTDSTTTGFMNFLIFNCFIIIGIMFYFMFANVITKIRECKSKKASESFSHLSVQEEERAETENKVMKSKEEEQHYEDNEDNEANEANDEP